MEESRLIEAFKWLHQHPELAMEERQTTEFVRGILSENGVRLLETGLETGLIAALGTGKGPVVALRADMDALPIQEATGLPYASVCPGVMHACGHDFHTACMLGAALLLKEREDTLPGMVKVIFQPAEEVNHGAALMVSTGLLDDVRLFLAGHTYPWYPAGVLGIRPGPAMAAADRFIVSIKGKGCHAAHPERGNDPIPAMAAMITAFQTIISRRTDPCDSAVLSVTRAEAGNTWNVIPETAVMEGTVRAMTAAVRDDIHRRMERMAADIAGAYGCEAAVEYERGPDPVVNDAEACERAAAAARQLGMRVETNPPTMIAEDFSEYLRLAPGVMFRVGTGGSCDNHHPSFTADPSVLYPAARFFATLAVKELERLDDE
ncbi:MAG: amidohydrolase [Eubacteriales bacterium]